MMIPDVELLRTGNVLDESTLELTLYADGQSVRTSLGDRGQLGSRARL